jgi:hypothetical protein
LESFEVCLGIEIDGTFSETWKETDECRGVERTEIELIQRIVGVEREIKEKESVEVNKVNENRIIACT